MNKPRTIARAKVLDGNIEKKGEYCYSVEVPPVFFLLLFVFRNSFLNPLRCTLASTVLLFCSHRIIVLFLFILKTRLDLLIWQTGLQCFSHRTKTFSQPKQLGPQKTIEGKKKEWHLSQVEKFAFWRLENDKSIVQDKQKKVKKSWRALPS